MAQTLLIKSNKSNAEAVPTTSQIQEKELAANLQDRSLFGRIGSSVFRFYEHPTKYFNSQGQANDAVKLEGKSLDYFATSAALETLKELVNNMGSTDTSNLVTKQEVIDNEEVIAATLCELDTRIKKTNEVITKDYITKEQFANYKTEILATIISNEEVTAAAVSNLKMEIEKLKQQLTLI